MNNFNLSNSSVYRLRNQFKIKYFFSNLNAFTFIKKQQLYKNKIYLCYSFNLILALTTNTNRTDVEIWALKFIKLNTCCFTVVTLNLKLKRENFLFSCLLRAFNSHTFKASVLLLNVLFFCVCPQTTSIYLLTPRP